MVRLGRSAGQRCGGAAGLIDEFILLHLNIEMSDDIVDAHHISSSLLLSNNEIMIFNLLIQVLTDICMSYMTI